MGHAAVSADFGPFTLTSGNAGFLATLDPTGSFVDVQQIGEGVFTRRGAPVGVTVDSSGNVILTGEFAGTGIDFPTGETLSSTPDIGGGPSHDIFLVKLFADDPSNMAPTADAGGPYVGTEDTAITLDAALRRH